MRCASGLIATLVAVTAVTAGAARADWGAFYLGSAPVERRAAAVALTDRTGMHPQAHGWKRPRLQPMTRMPEQTTPFPPSLEIADDQARCVAEILRAQQRYGIPNNLLLGIGLQEAGVSRNGRLTVWPWAVNAVGEGRIFENQASAMAWVRERQAAGVRSIDVGCMQINLQWHPTAFASLEQGFDPVVNVDYAARFLLGLYDDTGDWMKAAGAYHSRTPDRAEIYLASLRRNVAVANDRIATFETMIGAGSVDDPAGAFVQTAAPLSDGSLPAQPAAWDHGHWSTGPDDAGGTYGIYSRAQLEPVLPDFLHDF